MRRLFLLSFLLAALVAQAQNPLREAEILKQLAAGTSSKRVAALVRESGVDFSLTPESEERLRALGADDELIAAIRSAAAARAAGAAEAPKPPLTEAEILKGLGGGISNHRLVVLVGRYGVDFSLTAESEERLRALGADEELMAAIGKVKPIPKTPAQKPTKVNPKDGLTYVWIPPGTFQMGCSPGGNECGSHENPAHSVTITKGFWIGQTEVMQAAYQRVVGTNPSHFHGDRLPVEQVSWDDANSYCQAVGMRLPTEAEWEYAARAGSTASRYGDLDAVAWYRPNSGDQTHEVGQRQPNAWGLDDMLGNVSEWVADWYDVDGNYYSQSPSQDPQGPSSGQFRVVRGGSWYTIYPLEVRVSNRDWYPPAVRNYVNGFRCGGEVP
jgi:formylglycine-generating enzyme required for sulfatase activity